MVICYSINRKLTQLSPCINIQCTKRVLEQDNRKTFPFRKGKGKTDPAVHAHSKALTLRRRHCDPPFVLLIRRVPWLQLILFFDSKFLIFLAGKAPGSNLCKVSPLSLFSTWNGLWNYAFFRDCIVFTTCFLLMQIRSHDIFGNIIKRILSKT